MKNVRIESALARSLTRATGGNCPPKLAAALRHAVFPGGGRIRPTLCLAVAEAAGVEHTELADAAATSLELLHCASLVHDDMPCFDDAETRRGQSSVHKKFGEEIALLAGDALIVQAFDELARTAALAPTAMSKLAPVVSRAVGASHGITGGQAWESEERVDVDSYHRAKTGAMFEAATVAGAIAAGSDEETWRPVGRYIGQAYQVADDIADAFGDEATLGKPAGQDEANERPSAVSELGLPGAVRQLDELLEHAINAIPECRGRERLAALLHDVGTRLCPPAVRARIAQHSGHETVPGRVAAAAAS